MFVGACIVGFTNWSLYFGATVISLDICEFAGILKALTSTSVPMSPQLWMEALAFILHRWLPHRSLWIFC
jgi:hypothetical protein